jgi:hypothetical protein
MREVICRSDCISRVYTCGASCSDVSQWLRIELHFGPNWVGVPPFHLRRGTGPFLEGFCDLILNSEKWMSPKVDI